MRTPYAAAIKRAGLFDPIVARNAAVELEVGVELGRRPRRHRGELPIVEDAVLVELLDDLRADAGQLGEIVGRAARRGEQLEMLGRLGGRRFGLDRLGQDLGDRRLGGADIDAVRALAARDAVDRRARDEVAVELDGAAGVVVGGDGKGDAVGIAVGVDDGDDRDLEAVGFLDRQRFLVGVDDEDEIGHAAHVLDAAERLLELLALAREHQALLLGEALGAFAQASRRACAAARSRPKSSSSWSACRRASGR